jgi:hypothetical protein
LDEILNSGHLAAALGRFDAEYEYWRRFQAKLWEVRRTFQEGKRSPHSIRCDGNGRLATSAVHPSGHLAPTDGENSLAAAGRGLKLGFIVAERGSAYDV